MSTEPLQRAIKIAGGQTALAVAIGVSQQRVSHWLNKARRVPAEYASAIERATGGKVGRGELRPDVFTEAA